MIQDKQQLFRKKHLLALLESYQDKPIDFHVSTYFRANKALGSKDRAYIAEEVYRLIRWQLLIDYHLPQNPSWNLRLEWLQHHDPKTLSDDSSLPDHVRLSMPKDLYDALVSSWGKEEAKNIALASNEAAPTCVRANVLKIGRDELVERFKKQGFLVAKGQEAPTAIYFRQKCNFFTLPEFQEGLFEVQDEASQLAALMVQAKPNNQVLDFCAGSGGKTLAFAPYLEGRGQIFLHDIRPHALVEAKKRLKRAGIHNAQTIKSTEQARLKKLKKQMDWVLVDAPCSGTGTLRRNPDMKYKFSLEMVSRLVSEQRVIFEQALSYLKPSGYIVYATCSILQEENQQQIAHFLKTYSLEVVGEPFISVPKSGEKDGFFAICFRKKA
jgi:16S rRNA C967 or C1407 C5-methylase (RsmB/RsmF family)